MAKQAGCCSVTIADVDAGRVDYAIEKGIASHGFVVPRPLHHRSDASNSLSQSSSGTSTPLEGMLMTASTLSFHNQLDASKNLAAEVLAMSRRPSS